MIPVGRTNFFPGLLRFRQCYKPFINYILGVHVKSLNPARQDPSFVLQGPLCRDKISPRYRFSLPKRDKKVN